MSSRRPFTTSSKTPGALWAALLLAFVSTACAQQPLAYTLDPATTAVHWTLDTNTHTVHGTFKLKSGTLQIDAATGAAAGQIVVDAASGESGDSTRDKRMNNVVLESQKFPAITFRFTHIASPAAALRDGGTVTASGIFTLHGQDHPIDLTVELAPKAGTIALRTHFTIPFVAWGLKDPSVLLFRTDKQVTLDIDAIATPAPPPQSPARAILRPSEVGTAR